MNRRYVTAIEQLLKTKLGIVVQFPYFENEFPECRPQFRLSRSHHDHVTEC